VDEWLTRDWNESAARSASPILQQWHRKLHVDFVAGSFLGLYDALPDPDLWQVAFQPHNAKKNFEKEPEVYFLVRWRPPYHLTHGEHQRQAVGPAARRKTLKPTSGGTLFSTQEWRW